MPPLTPPVVLLIEDDANDVLLLQRAFRKIAMPYPVMVVRNGAEALAYLAGAEPYSQREQYPLPTLILMDIKLPYRSGLEILAWLRQQPALQRLLVVMLTSSREVADINRAYELGANSYLVKPVNYEQLVNIVTQVYRYWLTLNEPPSLAPPTARPA